MENITLAGGTLMDTTTTNTNTNTNTNNTHSHGHAHSQHGYPVDPLSNANQSHQKVTLTHEQQIELSKLVLKPHSHNQPATNNCPHHHHDHHHHSHGHSHNNNTNTTTTAYPRVHQSDWKTVQGGIQVPVAALSLMIPLEEILKGSPKELMEALSTLLRLGQYEKWQSLATTLIERETNGQQTLPAATSYNNNNNSNNNQQQQPPPDMSDDSDHTTNSVGVANNSSNNNTTGNNPTKYNPTNTWWLWIDTNGHTLLHWAAKRGDDKRFVEFFMTHAPGSVLTKLLHTNSHDSTAMTPLHWACTEPGAQSLGILSLFMTLRPDIQVDWEVTDASGCTPLLIAAQYGQVEVCAYLLQKGRADLWAMDNSRDTALHWAAYKGSLPVCGLLWWYNTTQKRSGNRHDDLMAPDQYGQTPLHLAALRGHTSTVRWLLHRTASTKRDTLDLLYHKDNNGRTPLDLAIHKQRPTVQVVLQEEQDKLQSFNLRGHTQWQIWKRNVAKSLQQMTSVHAWKMWMGLIAMNDESDTAPQLPYYYMWFQGLMIMLVWYPLVFCPIHTPSTGLLWDFPFWHLLNVMNMICAVIMLRKTTTTNPGNLVVDSEEEYKRLPKDHKKTVQYWRKLYETTLESYATTSDMQQAIQQQVGIFFVCSYLVFVSSWNRGGKDVYYNSHTKILADVFYR